MKKADLIRAVAKKTGYTIGDTSDVVNSLFEIIEDTVASGEEVAISGFGKFVSRTRAARDIKNPRTGELMSIPEVKTAAFTVGGQFKEKVRG